MYLEAWARRSRGGAFLSLSIDRGGGGKKLGNSWQLPLLLKRARNWCRNGCQVPDCASSNVECEKCKMRKMWSKIFASSLYAGLEECQEKQPKDTKTNINLYLCTSALEGGLGDTREQLSLWGAGDRGEVVGKNWREFLATPHLRRKQTIACVPPQ